MHILGENNRQKISTSIYLPLFLFFNEQVLRELVLILMFSRTTARAFYYSLSFNRAGATA